jgi:hypothetical protein
MDPSSQQYISFAEIVKGRDASVRITDDRLLYAVDLAMVVTAKNRNDAGQAIRNLKEETFQSGKFTERYLSLNGGHPTKLVTLQDAIELVMVLPGKVAREVRAGFADIIRRYLAGDHSLITEIQQNAASDSPIAQLARDSLEFDQPPVEDPESRRKRIKREDLEIARLEQDIQKQRIQNMHDFLGLMAQIRPDWMESDARFRLQTEDMVKNILTPPGTLPAITNGNPQPASLSISQLAQELGCRRLTHSDSIQAGKLAVKRYKAIHDREPPTHRQWVDGAERNVRSYTEADRGMLTAVLTDLGLVPGQSSSSASSSVAGSSDGYN